jgi:hypothetical protein
MSGNVVREGTGGLSVCETETCLDRVIGNMDDYGVSISLIMNPPAPAGASVAENEAALQRIAAKSGDRLVYAGGGGVLNPFLQEAGRQAMSEARREEFEVLARGIAESGAHGFGETTALHLSLAETHAFEQVSPDNELFLLLADLAAEYDIPIDLHMDPILEDMETPAEFQELSSRNPEVIEENMTAFERLLAHNPDAKIVWAHVGRNNLGNETVELYRRLLDQYANLFLQLSVHPGAKNAILDSGREIEPEWLALFEDFPDRFVMGSDTFYGESSVETRPLDVQQSFLEQLPAEIAQAIASDNAKRIYNL